MSDLSTESCGNVIEPGLPCRCFSWVNGTEIRNLHCKNSVKWLLLDGISGFAQLLVPTPVLQGGIFSLQKPLFLRLG